jgi:peptidoglycan glycosyltransferase
VAESGHKPIRDSEYYSALRKGGTWRGWGSLDLKEAMLHSSNVYFAQLGAACSEALLQHTMTDLMIGAKLEYMRGSDGSLGAVAGATPSLHTRWHRAQAAIGQGDLLVTPLHVACYTAAAANKGVLFAPRLNQATAPLKLSQPFTASTAYTLKVMLREAVKRGTGRAVDLKGFDVCGKTGTAQVGEGADHAWFTCFAPFYAPEIVVTVIIENGGFGAAAALPVARGILFEAEKLELIKRAQRGRR